MDDIHNSLNGIFRSLEAPTFDHFEHDEGFRPASHIYNRQGTNVDTDEEDMEEALSHMLMGGRHVSDDSSDDDIQPAKRPRTVRFRGQDPTERNTRAQYQEEENTDSDLEDDNLTDPPDWFLWQPFQHSRLLVLPFVLGGILPLLLGGDMLIAVITLGALISHLFYEGGSSKHASTACITATVCAAIVIIYNITPIILWTSISYVIVLASSFTYTILTGAWPLLLMKDFCRREPDLAYYLEGLLFTVYPLSSIILLTWTICMVTSVHYAPYILLVTGFLFFRMFLRPTNSSFVKDDWPEEWKKLITDPAACLGMSVCLAVIPTVSYLIIHLLTRTKLTLVLGVAFEGFSILLASIFLVTFLHLSIVIDHFGIPRDFPLLTRKIAAIAIIITSTLALHFHGYKSMMLPWWPLVFLCAWTAQGYSLTKTEKRHSIFLTANVLVLSLLVLLQMPWSFMYSIGHTGWSVQPLYLTILFNASLCTGCVYASRYCTKDVFSCLLLAQSFIFSYLVSVLHYGEVMSAGFVIVLQAFCAYFHLRLHHVHKILWQHATLSASVHLTVMLITLATTQISADYASLPFLLGSASLYLLIVTTLHIFIREKSESIPMEKFVKYLSAVCVLSVCHLLCFPQVISLLQSSDESSVLSIILGFSLMLTGVPALKLVTFHAVASDIAKSLWIVLMVAGAALTAIQPAVSVQWFDVVRLLLLQAVVSGCILVVMVRRLQSTVPLYLLCSLTGLSMGVVGFTSMFDGSTPLRWFYMMMYGIQGGIVLSTAVTAYKQTARMEHIIVIMGVSSEVLSLVMVTSDLLVYGPSAAVCTPGLGGACMSVITLASIIKSQALYQLPQSLSDTSSKSSIPAVGNCATMLGFLYMCLLRPYHLIPVDIWLFTASSAFFLLRRDRVFLLQDLNRKNNMTPTVVAVSLYLHGNIVYHSPMLLPHRYFSSSMAALTEMTSTVLTAPVVVTLWVVLWYGDFRALGSWSVRGQALCVLCLMPFFLCYLLLPISTTYYSWAYGSLGLGAGTWLWKAKIPLTLL